MTTVEQPMRHTPFSADPIRLPILPSSTASTLPSQQDDPMDLSAGPPSSMGPPPQTQPAPERSAPTSQSTSEQEAPSQSNGTPAAPMGAAAAAQQPKVVQTAFIHKLYNMLEDQSIQHLISWSQTNESFVVSPNGEFSKVLASYFKHTNISSFVRQLNMYGFHKVSDVFHTGAPDATLWEFKHGNGSFRRGDLVGLREIKRRASRHALIHRDSFSTGPKVPPPQPGTPIEPIPDPFEARLAMLEHSMYEAHMRLARSEDSSAYLNSKCQVLTDGLLRCHQWNHEMSSHIMGMVPDPENPIHRDVVSMQREISRQIEMLKSYEEHAETPSSRSTYFGNLPHDGGPPISPRMMPHDESRRGSLAGSSRLTPYRPTGASHLAVSPRRYGSISGNSNYSPSARPPPQIPPQLPPMQHPLATVQSPSLARRHTAADIRVGSWSGQHQQQPPLPNVGSSPYASGHASGPWPSSPHRTPIGDQDIRNTLAQYELGGSAPRSRRASPPQDPASANNTNPTLLTPGAASSSSSSRAAAAAAADDAGWQLPGQKYPFRSFESGPPTRRSSMASNVHSLLNPAETAERPEDEDQSGGGKRKRVQ